MNAFDFSRAYREYLKRFGVLQPGDRIAEIHTLDVEELRFFAYSGDDALRLKAAIMATGVVTPGARPEDDWYNFLGHTPDATAAAERIAWLEADEWKSSHGLPSRPAAVLAPERPIAAGIDPAQWALVTAPTLAAKTDNSRTLVAWILAPGDRSPVRWTITARTGAPATIDRISAAAVLIADVGPATAGSQAAARARALLSSGTEDERSWALRHIGETGDSTSIPDVAALLTDPGASPGLRIQSAGTLARLGSAAAIPTLGDALRSDPAPEVRRAAAQALSRIVSGEAVQALWEGIQNQPDQIVRVEIVHALQTQGGTACVALAEIASSNADSIIKELARGSIDTITPSKDRGR